MSADQQRIRQSAASDWICYRDYEHPGLASSGRRTGIPSTSLARRMIIEEYGGFDGSRGRGTECVECLAAETPGPDDVKGH